MMSISPEKLASATALRTISHAGRKSSRASAMADLCRPGLQFAGYFDVFAFERPQVIGKTEMAYLDSLPEDVLLTNGSKRYFSYDIPCIIIARSMQCPPELLRQARKNGVPVYGSDEETSIFSAKAITYYERGARPAADLPRRAAGCVRRGADDYGRKRRGQERVRAGADQARPSARRRRRGGYLPRGARAVRRIAGDGARLHGTARRRHCGYQGDFRHRLDCAAHAHRPGDPSGTLAARARITTAWATRKRPWIFWAWSCR